MLGLLAWLGAAFLGVVIALTFVPGIAGMVPAAAIVRDVAAMCAVVTSLAVLFAWAPSDAATGKVKE